MSKVMFVGADGHDMRFHEPDRVRVVDLDTGEQIPFCRAANVWTGEYEQYVYEDGEFVIDAVTKKVRTVKGKARLRIDQLAPDEPYLLTDAVKGGWR